MREPVGHAAHVHSLLLIATGLPEEVRTVAERLIRESFACETFDALVPEECATALPADFRKAVYVKRAGWNNVVGKMRAIRFCRQRHYDRVVLIATGHPHYEGMRLLAQMVRTQEVLVYDGTLDWTHMVSRPSLWQLLLQKWRTLLRMTRLPKWWAMCFLPIQVLSFCVIAIRYRSELKHLIRYVESERLKAKGQ